MITVGGNIRIGGGIQTSGPVEVNGVKIDMRDPLGTCRRILANLDDEDVLEFAESLIDEIKSDVRPKKKSSKIIKEQRCVGESFFAIENTSGCTVNYSQKAGGCSVVIEGKEDEVKKICTSVDCGRLRVSIDDDAFFNIMPTINISSPVLENVSLEGSSDFASSTPIICEEDFSVSLMGSGDFTCPQVTSEVLDLDITASGGITIDKAEVRSVTAGISGSGDVRLKDSKVKTSAKLSVRGSGDILFNGSAKNISANVAGSGDIKGNVTCDMLSARVMGSGDIRFSGNIKSHTQSVMGSGDISIY